MTVRTEDQDDVFHGAYGRLDFQWADDGACERQERNLSVDRRVAEVSAARAVQEALERNREQDYAGARRLIESTAGDIGDFAGDDPDTLGTLANLRLKLDDVTGEMDSMSRKRGYAEAHGTLTGREFKVPVFPEEPARRAEAIRNVVLLPVSGVRTIVDATVPHLATAHSELFGDMIVDGRLGNADDGPVASVPLAGYECKNLVQLAFEVVPDARVRVVFTGRRLLEDKSSEWDQDYRTAVVSTADLSGQAANTPQAFVAAEIVFHALHLLGHGYDPIGLGHTETRGCLYDFSRTRANIEVFLDCGDLCPQCRAKLARHQLEIDPLLRLAETVRELAGCGPVVH